MQSTWAMLASLEVCLPVTAKNSERNVIQSDPSFPKTIFNLVTKSSASPRTLWKPLNTMLHRNPSNSFPESPDASSLANTFLDFFKDKIDRHLHQICAISFPDPFRFPPARLQRWSILFQPLSLKFISTSESKQCPLDCISTFLLKLCFNELGPIITNIVNLSLSEGNFPSTFEQALVQPLLKKPSLSTTFVLFQTSILFPKFSKKLLPIGYRNLAFNLTCLLTQCLLLFNLLTGSCILLKLLFWKFTMTLSLRWIVVRSLHSFFSTYLLSVAFDTVDQFILLTCLQNWIGLVGLSFD